MMEKLVIRENRQRVLVSKRIEKVGENKNIKRAVWNKNKKSDLVSKRIERICDLKNRKRVEYIKNRQSAWTGIEVNAARHYLLLLVEVNAARHYLLLLVKVNAARHKLTTTALVDGKKIIITGSTVRRDLQLEDAEGVDYLPNATIFEQLALMSAKTTAWNVFSSTMASAIICLATNQKFNFSKYIFESMVKNLDNLSRIFLMYLRFVQVFLDKQLEGMSNHNRIYVTPSHTKKGKGFSRRETLLFQTMVVQEQVEMGEGSANPTDPLVSV
ncbi:hypothetical protein Tco_1044066 [Tanacetum coccineum]|uniref:Uncharacterized protein n=1 Tax=Tanacetum coccineum TaxID=301880 RepID=A0ABQ5GNW7_9ASTR